MNIYQTYHIHFSHLSQQMVDSGFLCTVGMLFVMTCGRKEPPLYRNDTAVPKNYRDFFCTFSYFAYLCSCLWGTRAPSPAPVTDQGARVLWTNNGNNR